MEHGWRYRLEWRDRNGDDDGNGGLDGDGEVVALWRDFADAERMHRAALDLIRANAVNGTEFRVTLLGADGAADVAIKTSGARIAEWRATGRTLPAHQATPSWDTADEKEGRAAHALDTIRRELLQAVQHDLMGRREAAMLLRPVATRLSGLDD